MKKKRKESFFERFRWRRVRRQLLKLTPKRTCTDCGFLAFGEFEADASARAMFDTKGQLGGFPGPVEKWNCARNLWDWDLHYVEANWEAVTGEVEWDRRGCPGFLRHSPGRTPAEHFILETERIEFKRKLWLNVLPLVYGSIGAIIGVVFGWLLKR